MQKPRLGRQASECPRSRGLCAAGEAQQAKKLVVFRGLGEKMRKTCLKKISRGF